jgi:hypothetical protein
MSGTATKMSLTPYVFNTDIDKQATIGGMDLTNIDKQATIGGMDFMR